MLIDIAVASHPGSIHDHEMVEYPGFRQLALGLFFVGRVKYLLEGYEWCGNESWGKPNQKHVLVCYLQGVVDFTGLFPMYCARLNPRW